MKKLIPGLSLTFLIAFISYLISHLPFQPFTIHKHGIDIHPIESLIISIVLGIILGNSLLKKNQKTNNIENLNGVINSRYLHKIFLNGVKFSANSLLPLGIIFMGAKFDLYDLMKISGSALVINLLCMIMAYFSSIYICNKLKLDSKMSTLITIGTVICGSSAIAATSPVIKANETQTSIAMAVVSLYGLIAIFTFPLIGNYLGLTDLQYGIFSGAVIQAVPQVLAAGFAVSIFAGQVATVVKMVRILLLGPMVVLSGIKHRQDSENKATKRPWYYYCPRFIFYFLFMVILNSLGFFNWCSKFLHLNVATILLNTSFFLMTMAMAAIGLNTDLKSLINQGGKPLLAGGIAMIILGVFCLLVLYLYHLI